MAPKDRDRKGKGKMNEKVKEEIQENEPGESAEFEIILDELKDTYENTMTKDIPTVLFKILEQEAPKDQDGKTTFQRVHGKLYAPKRGTFIVKIKPSRESPPETHLSLLFRWSDLYFEAFHCRGEWFRFTDAKELLPPRSQLYYPEGKDGVHTLEQNTSYGSIGGSCIRIGISAFEDCYNALINAGEHFRLDRLSKFSSSDILAFPVLVISEALRFLLFQEWVVDMLSKGIEEHVPIKFSKHFQNWENNSFKMFTDPNPPRELQEMLGILKKNSRVVWPPTMSDRKEKEKAARRLRIQDKTDEKDARLRLLNNQREIILNDQKLLKQMRGLGWKEAAIQRLQWIPPKLSGCQEMTKGQEKALQAKKALKGHIEEQRIFNEQEQLREIIFSKKHNPGDFLQKKTRLPRMLEHKEGAEQISQISARGDGRETARTESLHEKKETVKLQEEFVSVCVGNLPPSTSVLDLEKVFKAFGRIKPDGVSIQNYKEAGVFCGFVEFEDVSGTQNALNASPIELNGCLLRVELKRLNCGFPRGGSRGRGRDQASGRYDKENATRSKGITGEAHPENRTPNCGFPNGPRRGRGRDQAGGRYEGDHGTRWKGGHQERR